MEAQRPHPARRRVQDPTRTTPASRKVLRVLPLDLTCSCSCLVLLVTNCSSVALIISCCLDLASKTGHRQV